MNSKRIPVTTVNTWIAGLFPLVVLGFACGSGGGSSSPAPVGTTQADSDEYVREAGPLEGGLLGIYPPTSVQASLSDGSVEVRWRSGRAARHFVVVRRELPSGEWIDLVTVPFDHAGVPPYVFVDASALSRKTYAYGVKSRNVDKQRVLVESEIIEAAPITVP